MRVVRQPKGEIRKCEKCGVDLAVAMWLGRDKSGVIWLRCEECGEIYEEETGPSLKCETRRGSAIGGACSAEPVPPMRDRRRSLLEKILDTFK